MIWNSELGIYTTLAALHLSPLDGEVSGTMMDKPYGVTLGHLMQRGLCVNAVQGRGVQCRCSKDQMFHWQGDGDESDRGMRNLGLKWGGGYESW